ncbi:hypothetical protein LWI29_035318 [Acer saccharum]|uniref:RNase H type-1 domain-containing protein n=1 Tax=Acer saccharum TaxID=4024 RepID=A0AA39W8A8_ACESA|nr:hypothetical protein LWI29_035318 [Acer saccharum]
MSSCSQFLVASFDNNVAGIMAILRGILFSKDCGLSPCVLEFDKKSRRVVVERVLNRNLRNASYGSMLYEIDELISHSFGLTTSAIPISAKRAAHRLANFTLESVRNNYWMEDYPFCIRDLVLADKFSCGPCGVLFFSFLFVCVSRLLLFAWAAMTLHVCYLFWNEMKFHHYKK